MMFMDPRKRPIHLLPALVFLVTCLGALSAFAIPSDWEQKAKEALEKGQLGAARSQAESALADPSTAVAGHRILGRVAMQERKYNEAIEHFQAAHELNAQRERSELGSIGNDDIHSATRFFGILR